MKMRRFVDTETDEVLTIEDLRTEYEELKASGETEAETFGNYISNCQWYNNGTLEEVWT